MKAQTQDLVNRAFDQALMGQVVQLVDVLMSDGGSPGGWERFRRGLDKAVGVYEGRHAPVEVSEEDSA